MGLFGRKNKGRFWEASPFQTNDPEMLHYHAISCLSSGNGQGAISAGWAIWRLAGVHQYQAADFIRDGYTEWRDSASFDRELAAHFLSELVAGLSANPVLPGSVWDLPPVEVDPFSAHYGVRTWAASERLEVLSGPERTRWEPEAYRLISTSYREFVPGRSERWAEEYASANGLPQPWG